MSPQPGKVTVTAIQLPASTAAARVLLRVRFHFRAETRPASFGLRKPKSALSRVHRTSRWEGAGARLRGRSHDRICGNAMALGNRMP